MKNRHIYILMLLALIFNGSCKRQDFKDGCYATARIFVEVNWDNSGINPDKSAESYNVVHRVSLRFFPKDGSEPFERYLETSVYSGFIELPVGEYSIMAMNESVKDVYWNERLKFTDINDYNKIAAIVVSDNPSLYRFYTPTQGELFMKEAHKLASWSMNDFSVTPNMVTRTHADASTPEHQDVTIKVNMRRLTYDTRILVTVKNLKSAHTIQGALRGFSPKVYLASAESEDMPSTQFFKLRTFAYDEGSTLNGMAETTFQSFGKLPESAEAEYTMGLDVILIDGSSYVPGGPYDYNVTDVVRPQNDTLITIAVSIELPERDGDENITVGDWEDEEHIDL